MTVAVSSRLSVPVRTPVSVSVDSCQCGLVSLAGWTPVIGRVDSCQCRLVSVWTRVIDGVDSCQCRLVSVLTRVSAESCQWQGGLLLV